MKICSLLPSATEIVFTLGLGDSLVGVTHECDYPTAAQGLPVVTASVINHEASSGLDIHRHITEAVHLGTSIYQLKTDLLAELAPDLLLTQELCDVCAVAYRLVSDAVKVMEGEQTIVSLEPTSISGILDTIDEVGRVTGRSKRAAELRISLEARVEQVTTMAADLPRSRVFALEWTAPPFVGGHWVPEMIHRAGGEDGLGIVGKPSFEIEWGRVRDYDPEVLIAMPCGYNLEQTRAQLQSDSLSDEWLSLTAVRNGNVYLVDGSAFFNRPGPRIVDGLEILAEILHPERFPRAHDMNSWQKWTGS